MLLTTFTPILFWVAQLLKCTLAWAACYGHHDGAHTWLMNEHRCRKNRLSYEPHTNGSFNGHTGWWVRFDSLMITSKKVLPAWIQWNFANYFSQSQVQSSANYESNCAWNLVVEIFFQVLQPTITLCQPMWERGLTTSDVTHHRGLLSTQDIRTT